MRGYTEGFWPVGLVVEIEAELHGGLLQEHVLPLESVRLLLHEHPLLAEARHEHILPTEFLLEERLLPKAAIVPGLDEHPLLTEPMPGLSIARQQQNGNQRDCHE